MGCVQDSSTLEFDFMPISSRKSEHPLMAGLPSNVETVTVLDTQSAQGLQGCEEVYHIQTVDNGIEDVNRTELQKHATAISEHAVSLLAQGKKKPNAFVINFSTSKGKFNKQINETGGSFAELLLSKGRAG